MCVWEDWTTVFISCPQWHAVWCHVLCWMVACVFCAYVEVHITVPGTSWMQWVPWVVPFVGRKQPLCISQYLWPRALFWPFVIGRCDFMSLHSLLHAVGVETVLLVELYEFCEANWQWLYCCLWSVWPNFTHFWLHTKSTDIICSQIVLLFKKFSCSALVDIMPAILLWWGPKG